MFCTQCTWYVEFSDKEPNWLHECNQIHGMVAHFLNFEKMILLFHFNLSVTGIYCIRLNKPSKAAHLGLTVIGDFSSSPVHTLDAVGLRTDSLTVEPSLTACKNITRSNKNL